MVLGMVHIQPDLRNFDCQSSASFVPRPAIKLFASAGPAGDYSREAMNDDAGAIEDTPDLLEPMFGGLCNALKVSMFIVVQIDIGGRRSQPT